MPIGFSLSQEESMSTELYWIIATFFFGGTLGFLAGVHYMLSVWEKQQSKSDASRNDDCC